MPDVKSPSRLRALITGATGFAGTHLAEKLLSDKQVEVWGTSHRSTLAELPSLAGLQLIPCDVRNPQSVRAVLGELRPNWIFHLAGQSDAGGSWGWAWETIEANVRGQLNILEVSVQLNLDARLLVVGSNYEYGIVPREAMPINEDTPLRPDSPYGISKVAQDLLGLQFFLSRRVRAVRVRCFNYIGPRQSTQFVASSFARQIAEIEAGLREPVVRVGNLEAERDFTDVRDVTRAYVLALEKCADGEVYNIGSGRATSIRRVLDILLSYATCRVRVEPDAARMRPSDMPYCVCDNTKFRQATGWAPAISLEQSLRDVLAYWREELSAKRVVAHAPERIG
jgi:GDP-4-dehydro-6-deoxy-D-mannose reductase